MPTTRLALCLFTVLLVADLAAQSLTDARRRFDAGKYGDAIEAIGAPSGDNARLLFLKGLSYEKLGQTEDAVRAYSQLMSSSEPGWSSTGQSAIDLVHKQPQEALESANRAVDRNPTRPEAHYQRGLALTFNQDFAKAASAFDKAAELDPQWAYARYYAGLSYYKAKRIDLLSTRFEAFLRLAPDAPERPEVESIMRTIRGR